VIVQALRIQIGTSKWKYDRTASITLHNFFFALRSWASNEQSSEKNGKKMRAIRAGTSHLQDSFTGTQKVSSQ